MSCGGVSASPSSTSPTKRPAAAAGPPSSTEATASPQASPASGRPDAGNSTDTTSTPNLGRASPRLSPGSAIQLDAALLGTERAVRPKTIALIPTTSPAAFRSGPPELPGASATSDRTYLVEEPQRERLPGTSRPLTTPAVAVPGLPHGWPTAKTSSPTRRASESPTRAAGSPWASPRNRSSARSSERDRLRTSASSTRPSCRTTRAPPRRRPPETTWLLVRTRPSPGQITPAPDPRPPLRTSTTLLRASCTISAPADEAARATDSFSDPAIPNPLPALADGDVQLSGLAAPDHPDGHGAPDPLTREQGEQVVGVLDRPSVQGRDYIPDHEAAAVRRAPVFDPDHQQAALLGVVRLSSVGEAHRLAQDAEVAPLHGAPLLEHAGDAPGKVRRDRERRPASPAGDHDPDDVPVHVHQRPAR